MRFAASDVVDEGLPVGLIRRKLAEKHFVMRKRVVLTTFVREEAIEGAEGADGTDREMKVVLFLC